MRVTRPSRRIGSSGEATHAATRASGWSCTAAHGPSTLTPWTSRPCVAGSSSSIPMTFQAGATAFTARTSSSVSRANPPVPRSRSGRGARPLPSDTGPDPRPPQWAARARQTRCELEEPAAVVDEVQQVAPAQQHGRPPPRRRRAAADDHAPDRVLLRAQARLVLVVAGTGLDQRLPAVDARAEQLDRAHAAQAEPVERRIRVARRQPPVAAVAEDEALLDGERPAVAGDLEEAGAPGRCHPRDEVARELGAARPVAEVAQLALGAPVGRVHRAEAVEVGDGLVAADDAVGDLVGLVEVAHRPPVIAARVAVDPGEVGVEGVREGEHHVRPGAVGAGHREALAGHAPGDLGQRRDAREGRQADRVAPGAVEESLEGGPQHRLLIPRGDRRREDRDRRVAADEAREPHGDGPGPRALDAERQRADEPVAGPHDEPGERAPAPVVLPPRLQPVDREVDVAPAALDELVPLAADAVEGIDGAEVLDAEARLRGGREALDGGRGAHHATNARRSGSLAAVSRAASRSAGSAVFTDTGLVRSAYGTGPRP